MSDQSNDKAAIEIMDDGPFIVKGLTTLKNSRGDKLQIEKTAALCRCGSSSNKPFCDGMHKKVGFSGKRETDKPLGREKEYPGEEITVHDNRLICSHAAECVSNLPNVFRLGDRPWIAPDNASIEEVITVIKKCPSGALSYTAEGTTHRDIDLATEIVVTKNGPYNVTGHIELKIEGELKPPSTEHYVLCRCGASKNKPYCDGSHKEVDFNDDAD
jgi:CDGSH-type Zn-finger protein